MAIWFLLIGISTLLTWQHHVIDVVGGLIVGALCLYLWQEETLREPLTPNPRIGIIYAAAAILFAAAAILLRPWGLMLLWPAISLSLVTAAYFRLGPGIYRKRDGRLPLLSRIILAPVLLGQWVSLAWYATRSKPWDALSERVWIGRKLFNTEVCEAVTRGVISVLDLSGEFSEAPAFRSVNYCQLSVMDLTAPTAEQLRQAVEFIQSHCESGIVYVHCKAGYSRTAAVAGAYLLATGEAQTAEQAVRMLRNCRARLVVRAEALAAIENFARHCPGAVHSRSNDMGSGCGKLHVL